MNKPILTLLAILYFAVPGQGQIDFGLKGGVNLPTYSYGDKDAHSYAESIVSYYASGYMDIPIASHLYLYPELSLQGKGAKIIKTDAVDGANEIIQRINWVQVPVHVLGKATISNRIHFFAGAGPYVGFSMNGENSYADGSTSAVIIYKDNAIKSFDYGVNFMAGLKLGFISLHSSYSYGLANVTYDTNKWSKDIKNRVFSLGVGVSFSSLHH